MTTTSILFEKKISAKYLYQKHTHTHTHTHTHEKNMRAG